MWPKFLISSTYPVEKLYFLVPRFDLLLLGFYPETRQTWPVRIWAFICFLSLSYCSLTSLIFAISKFWVSVREALDVICPDASSITSLVKMLCIWYYRDDLKFLIQRLRELLREQNSPEKLKVKRFYFTLATRLIFIITFLGFWTATSYVMRSNIANISLYMRDELILYEMPYHTVFPEFALHLPWLPITFVFAHWYGYINAFCFSAADGLFSSICFYIAVLFKSLAFDLRDAFQDQAGSSDQNCSNEEDIQIKLASIIERYNELDDLMAFFSKKMVLMTLVQFITSSITIGISTMNFLLFPGYDIIIYIFYVTCVVGETFLYCLGGTYVIESSQELANVAYFTPWYNHSVKIQKMILTLMTRTQRSIVVKIPFFAPALPVLTSIFRTTGSLIAVFKAML